jgi:probable rRNA maturation factor
MVEVVNRQRRLKIETRTWATFASKALEAIGKSESSATIAFVSDKSIQKLNRQFRDIDKATDVLSFPADEPNNLGDVAISIDTAASQAKANGLSLENEIAQLILHGLLHLSGYDHETDDGEMNRLELRLRRQLKI